jgi:hypothetical protein
MAGLVAGAERASWRQAGRFAEEIPGGGELGSFEGIRRHAPGQPILV